jgi:hypothetical protein
MIPNEIKIEKMAQNCLKIMEEYPTKLEIIQE